MTARAPGTFPAEVIAWNDTARPYAADRTIAELLDAAALAHPDQPALATVGGIAMTHGELARTTRRLAAQLAGTGVGAGTAVGVLLDHDPGAVCALIAIVRAGGHYVPLDSRWPTSRCADVCASLGVTHLVVGAGLERAAFEIAGDVPGLELVVMAPGSRPAEPGGPDPALAELWDGIAASSDPTAAAGFNLDGGDHAFTLDEVEGYAAHVASLVLERLEPGSAVVEIGAGSGQIVRALLTHGAPVVALDPAASAMARLAAEDETGLLTTLVGYAHEAAGYLRDLGGVGGVGGGVGDDGDAGVSGGGGDADVGRAGVGGGDGDFGVGVVVLASTVQYFPGVGYLRSVLDGLIRALRPGASVVVADLIDPRSGQFPGSLRVPRNWWQRFASGYAGLGVDLRERDATTLAGPLRSRYDVMLTVEAPVSGGPDRVPRCEAPAVWSDLPTAPLQPVTATELAYAITTSGSTGVPKSVAVRHRSVVNLADWFNRRNGVGPGDVAFQSASWSFDLSVYDVFGVLAAGACLLLLPQSRLAEPEAVIDALLDHQVTLWNSAPAAFSALLPFLRLRPATGRDALRRVFLSGDWVPLSMHADLSREFPGATLVALGGATEACVWSNDFVVTRIDPDWASIPYGHPMQNSRYYVLDADGAPCALDEPGELYIAGDCVAAGYLNDPQLSAQKFLPDPWHPNETMYRTGDRARWTSHGWVEFLGRLDRQVKVRGYRIELGELEQAAARMAGVDETVALTYGEARDPEIGLAVRARQQLSEQAVRVHLRSLLPEYMLPTRIRILATFPVSATGKVDRNALSAQLAEPQTPPAPRTPARGRIRVIASGRGVGQR